MGEVNNIGRRAMDVEDVSRRLKFEWASDGGFLYGIRSGHFEQAEADRFLAIFDDIDESDPKRFDPRIAGVIWVIPYYMLSHIHNSESLGFDVSRSRKVMRDVADRIAAIFGRRESASGDDSASPAAGG